MTETATASAPAQGLLARFIGIITSPTATFRSVVAHPRPMAMLFLTAAIVGLAAGLPQFTEAGKQAAIDMNVKMVESMTKQPVTPEMYDSFVKRAAYGGYMSAVGAFVFMPIVCLFFAGLYFVIFNAILGGTATFKQVLAVVAHSQVISAVGAAIGSPIQMMQGTMNIAGPFNLGVLVQFLDENSFLARLLGSTNVFTIWGLLVLGIGLGVLYKRSGMKIGIVLNLVYLLFAAAAISIFGSFMSR
jgi:hypothetical protein